MDRMTDWDGTSWGGARFLAMTREIDCAADELREDGARLRDKSANILRVI
jgi:hypothetical protein